jgi:hypothetical protein
MSRMTVLDSPLRRVADAASLMLDSAERDAVCGDLAESGESGSQALREVLSLVVRRCATCLRGWRPWLTLVSLTVPLSVLVSLLSRRTADGTAIYLALRQQLGPDDHSQPRFLARVGPVRSGRALVIPRARVLVLDDRPAGRVLRAAGPLV